MEQTITYTDPRAVMINALANIPVEYKNGVPTKFLLDHDDAEMCVDHLLAHGLILGIANASLTEGPRHLAVVPEVTE